MRRQMRASLAAAVAAVTMLTAGGAATMPVLAKDSALTAFEQAFQTPDNDAKPFVRWWIAPGRMTEEEVRREMQNFAEGGYGGVELQCLELAKNCQINDATWNQTMKWILQAGIDYGIQVDFTIGQMWPIATPEITDVDDDRTEQLIWNAADSVTVSADNMVYQRDGFVLPEPSSNPRDPGFDESRKYELVAVTAAQMLDDGSFNPETAVDVLADGATVFDEETGSISWTAPSEGNWTVFWFYRQSANHMVQFISPSQYVIDHMSEEGTRAVIDNWESAMESDPELEALYEQNGGSLFGDSFELRSNLWTPRMLEEFEARRGYDLTPYLPAASYDFGSLSERIINDLYETMTELLSENHMGQLSEWAHSHNMTLRYQAYSSAGSSPFELTDPALHTDIIEVESYAMSGTVPDSYRQLSGAVNMRGDQIFSAEAAEIGQDDWRETWTDTQLQSGSDSRHRGFMYYAYRLFAAGVNKTVFHGATYHLTDSEGLFAPMEWPGYSAMALMNYGNEWDNKTPMWENVDIMTDALARFQMVLQQGQGDVDLAVYRNLYGKGNVRNEITAVEQAGYTYDYVTPTVLNMDNAVVGSQDGQTVLAADGPSYKALVIEPMADGTVPTMPLETAEKILDYARNGLPVVIIGDAPSHVDSYPGVEEAADGTVGSVTVLEEADAQLAAYMSELADMANVRTVASRDGLAGALASLGVAPDAHMEAPSNIYFNHRTTDAAELYFIYNDSAEMTEQNVTMKGDGAPYQLDPWSGEITPVAEYTVNGDGTVTFAVSIDSEDALLFAVAQDGWSSKPAGQAVVSTNADAAVYDGATGGLALRSAQGGELTAELNDGTTVTVTADAAQAPISLTDWTMVLDQWTQGEGVYDIVVVPTEEYDLSETGLVPWYEIDPENLTNVAGVATYRTSFELEKGWTEGQGAYLDFADVSDVVRLFVNGTEVDVNQISLHTDIGEYLTAGTNTVEAQVTSNMSNVKYGNNPNNTYAFGIIGEVTVTPYTQVSLEAPAPEAPSITGPEELPEGVVGEEYSAAVSADGEELIWALNGELPAGLSFADGVIAGTPKEAGTYMITISVSNSGGTDSKDYSLVIREAALDPDEPTVTPEPTEPSKPTVTPKPLTPGTGGNHTTGGQGGSSQAGNSPDTGDSSNMALWIAVIIAAGGVTAVILKKRLSH